MGNRKLTDEDLAWAKAKYMKYETVKDIAAELNVPRSTLQYYVNEKWKKERQLSENEMIADFGSSRIAKLNLIAKHSSDIILKSLENLKNRDKPPTTMEARAAVTIFEALDKIMRLDKGNPTDIISETRPLTIVELKKEFEQLDPFQDTEDEIIEITDETSKEDS